MQFLCAVAPGPDFAGKFLGPALRIAEDYRELGVGEVDEPAEDVELIAVPYFDIRL